MRFHLHPMDTRTQKFLPLHEQGLWSQKRIPIAERAQRSAQPKTITLEQARAHRHRENFELGANQFRLINHSELVEEDFIELAILHIGSIFEKAFVGLWFTDLPMEHPFLTVQALRPPVSIPQDSTDLIPARRDQRLLSLIFCLKPEMLFLEAIKTGQKRRGVGGKTVAALYNIAKGLNLSRIRMDRTQMSNINAQQFFYHTDFGAPEGPHSKDWIVKVDA